ncbi:response regulator receiver domain protein [Gemella bergeri ATCC 700627]|uniref:Response regulator receiver domain protein n=1 Tax=Gemella bergeri ATCC 700627 TaxID=1321820 RepID=U2S0Q5_9BACL|nr:response regulator transcription factor [Gemella bergeri]ERK56407.1 response regulator receiver domain protein [Gemella bergeri ATCC 700627]
MNILIIDNEEIILDGIAEFFKEENYNVLLAENGEQGLKLFNSNTVDLIILDLMLPKKHGFEVLKEIRKTSNIPVIILSALNDEQTQLICFDLDADDYVIKPFSLALLEKRVKALLTRHYGIHDTWSYGETIVDFTSYNATNAGRDVDIKPKELDILRLLLRYPNQVLTRRQIIEHAWSDAEGIPLERVIDVYIKNLRKKLVLDCIITVKNVGYKIKL